MRSAVTGRNLPLCGGALCLDFVNTVDPRLKPPHEEFLAGFAELANWGRYVRVLSVSQRRAMRTEGAAGPTGAAAAHRRAIELPAAPFPHFRAPLRSSPASSTT